MLGTFVADVVLRPHNLDVEAGVAGDQACIPGIEQPVPEPAGEYLQAVAETDQKGDVDAAPHEPGEKSAELEPADLRHRLGLADDRHRPLVAVDERRPLGDGRAAEHLSRDGLAGKPSHLQAALRHSRHRSAGVRRGRRRHVAGDENFGMTGDRQIGSDDHPPGAIERHTQRLSERAGLDTGRPEHVSHRNALIADVYPARRHVGDRRIEPDLDAHAFEVALRARAQLRRKRRQHPRPPFEQDHPGGSRIDVFVVPRHRRGRDLHDRSRQLDAGGAGADNPERERRSAGVGAGFVLRRLERQQDPAPQLGGIFDRLQSGRDRRPVVVAEVRVRGARREHEIVVADVPVRQHHPAIDDVDGGDRGQGDVAVLLFTDDRADRRADVGGGQRRRRDLVEKGLEDVMITAVQDRDGNRRLRQCPGRGESGEAAANDEDGWNRRHPPESTAGGAPYGVA